MNNYEHVGLCTAIEGIVAEIGLGWGYSADWAMANPKCLGLDSFEIDPQAVIDFNERSQGAEPRHSVIEQDFITHVSGKKYDFIYVDTMYNTEATRINTVNVVAQAKNRIKNTGLIAVEFWGDHPEERILRDWLKANFTESRIEKNAKQPGSHIRDIMYWS